ncbi:hypothetical protein PIB30_005275 [Stylosanthes scabra]|uniref:Uncharacterized protein n=1 Tax=Stylosanthes scabra TaxID=79078 RepID=A0ABU6U5C3_9FABA|nr:hypothetical protein [Stylosanthes scabra]
MRTPPPPSSSSLSSNSTTLANSPAGADLRNFHSPIPYLFGGLALMLALIAVSLLILACSFRNRYSSSDEENNNNNNDKPTKMVVDLEPKIAVIMAGETNPTYLAKPVILSVTATATTTTTTDVTANHSEKQAPSK